MFLRIDRPNFTSSRNTKYLKNFRKDLKNVFDVMHVSEKKQVELLAYQWKSVPRTWSVESG